MDPNRLHDDSPSRKLNDENLNAKKKFDDFANIRFSKTTKKEEKKVKGDLLSFMKENTKDTIAYVLLIAGIMMMFFDEVAIYGGLILGVVFGLYFAKELAYLATNAARLIEEEGIPKSLILGALFLIIIIKVPFLFIGAAFVAILRTFIEDPPINRR